MDQQYNKEIWERWNDQQTLGSASRHIRRLIMNVPQKTVKWHFDWKKRLVSDITLLLLFLNLPFRDDRYHLHYHA